MYTYCRLIAGLAQNNAKQLADCFENDRYHMPKLLQFTLCCCQNMVNSNSTQAYVMSIFHYRFLPKGGVRIIFQVTLSHCKEYWLA
jgi:hypothetical protein